MANAFGSPGGSVAFTTTARSLVPFTQSFNVPIGHWLAKPVGLGGWDLDVHHAYDPTDKVLYLGNGARRDAKAIYNSFVMTPYAGTGTNGNTGDGGKALSANVDPWGVAVGPDGGVYFADFNNHRIRKIDRDGVITKVAGVGGGQFSGDGGPALNAQFFGPIDLAFGPDGSLYVLDNGNFRVRRIAPNGIITTVAGNGTNGFSGDEGPAVAAQLSSSAGLAVGPDGSVYIADTQNNRIRKVAPDGIIHTVTTGGSPQGVAVGPDGSIYYTDAAINIIRRLGIDGTLGVFAGIPNASGAYTGDGGPATSARLNNPRYISVDKLGNVLILDKDNLVVRMVDTKGIINTVAGNNQSVNAGKGAPAIQQTIGNPQAVAFGPDQTFFVSHLGAASLVQRVYPAMPEFQIGTTLIPSEGGGELYVFNPNYQHTQTLNALTKAPVYSFGYDSGGRLASVTDGDGNATTIQRNGSGTPLSITAPFGQVTNLTLDANGFLAEIKDPQNQKTIMTYDSGGLMQTFKDPNGNSHPLSYDSKGRLQQDSDPAGGSTSLNLVSNTSNGFVVTKQSAMGRTTTFNVQDLANGNRQESNTAPDGTITTRTTSRDGSIATFTPDGMRVYQYLTPDPRWGMSGPLESLLVISPAGLASNTQV